MSYAREDAAFVDRLEAALRARGVEVFVDRSDIEKLSVWRERVAQLIAGSDTMIFVLTPDSASSASCHAELDLALGFNKRLAPVVSRPVEDSLVPPALQRINYVFFDSGHEFDRATDALVIALQTDIEWIREHTRLGDLARRWQSNGSSDDALLHGVEAIEARNWLASRPRHAPEPTELHRRYVAASADLYDRRRSTEWSRVSARRQVALGLIRGSDFRAAQRELDDLLGYLNEVDDRELRQSCEDERLRRDRLKRLADFHEAARTVYMRSGEEEFEPALTACENALAAVGALAQDRWWSDLPVDDLDARQCETLRYEIHRQMLLLAGLRMMPGIARLSPPRRSRIDVGRILRWIPASAIRAFAQAGGLDAVGLLRRTDNPEAVAGFAEGLAVLDRVDAFETWQSLSSGADFPASRTSAMLRRLGTLLTELARGPRGDRVRYRDLLAAPSPSGATRDAEALNPADYYFLGLFNFFIAKRADSAVAKIVGLFQTLFPDLDGRSPFATAERLLRTGVSREPENFWPHFVLGRTLLEAGDFRGAELAFNVCISIDPQYSRGFEQRALALAGQWQQQPHKEVLQRAEADSRRALALATADPSTWWPRGELLEKLDRLPEAFDAWMRWMELEEDLLARLSRGTGVRRIFDLADRTSRRPAASAALLADCYALQGLAHYLQNAPGEAATAADNALRISTEHAHAHLVRALLLHRAGDLEAAIVGYQRTMQLDRDIPLARLRRAEACEALRPDDRALQAWHDVIGTGQQNRLLPGWMRARAEAAIERLQRNQDPPVEKR